MIVEQLGHRDLVRLSSTCQSCRAHFAPLVFRTIRFGNDNKTSNSALVAVKAYGDYVRRLEFSYVAEPELVNDDELPPLLESHVLLPASRQLLEGCATPKADTVSIRLRFTDFYKLRGEIRGYNNSNNIFDLLHDAEHPIETMNAEQRYRWRAVFNETYRATAKNLIVRKIELVDLTTIAVSAFYTRRFGGLLGRLTSATIMIRSPGKFLRGDVLSLPGYCDFISRMPEVFFSRMHELTYLKLMGAWDYPLGGKAPNAVTLPLRPCNLPLLQSLELIDSFICPELADFIADHAGTLSSLALVDCNAGTDAGAVENRFERTETWAFFFLQLNELQPPALVNLSVSFESDIMADLYNVEYMPGSHAQSSDSIEETTVKIEQLQEEDPARTLFAYIGSYWPMATNPDGSVKGAQAIDDYYEYQRLMKLVKRNAQRVALKDNQICAV